MAWAATYFGVVVGPGKGDLTWEKALNEYDSRVNLWNGKALGLHYEADVYNVFCLSVISFVAQFEAPPEAVLERERHTRSFVWLGVPRPGLGRRTSGD